MPTSPRSFSNETLAIAVLVVVRKRSRPQTVKDALLKCTVGEVEWGASRGRP